MSKINQDGLIAGQTVDFETLMRVKRQAKVIQDEPAQPKPKARRKSAKTSATN